MSINKKIIVVCLPLLLTTFLLSSFSVSYLYNYISSMDMGKNKVESENNVSIESYKTALPSCLKNSDKTLSDFIKCDDKINGEPLSDSIERHDGKILLYIIKYLLVISLWVQLFLFSYILLSRKKIDCKYEYLSNWAINSAPMLGVLGTIISFALLIGGNDGESINKMFNEYFFSAAITTIVGGGIYIINLFLSMFIYPKIKV